MDAAYSSEIKGYLDRQGLLTGLPAKRKKKIIALCYLAEKIPPDKTYSEREFNALLNTLHTFGDPATLRRELFDHYLLDRDKEGRSYSLPPERPDTETLIEEYCGRQE